jgi:hypothetical protein
MLAWTACIPPVNQTMYCGPASLLVFSLLYPVGLRCSEAGKLGDLDISASMRFSDEGRGGMTSPAAGQPGLESLPSLEGPSKSLSCSHDDSNPSRKGVIAFISGHDIVSATIATD